MEIKVDNIFELTCEQYVINHYVEYFFPVKNIKFNESDLQTSGKNSTFKRLFFCFWNSQVPHLEAP
jgi:hypothetical protein